MNMLFVPLFILHDILIYYLWILNILPLLLTNPLPHVREPLLLTYPLPQVRWRGECLLSFSFVFLLPGELFSHRQILMNPVKNGMKLCRTIQTFEEEEKLFLVERPVLVGDMVPKFSSLSPSPSSLVQIPFIGDLGQGHPWLKLIY